MVSPLLYLALMPFGVSVVVVVCWLLDRTDGRS
jgi:uncharacterized membrane protein